MGYTDGSKGVTGAAAGRQQPRLLDEVRRCLRLKHDSVRTEQAYVAWIRRFILASGKRHPREMRQRSAATQDTHSPAQRDVNIRRDQDRSAVIEASRSAGTPQTIW